MTNGGRNMREDSGQRRSPHGNCTYTIPPLPPLPPFARLRILANLDLVEEFPTHFALTPLAISMRVMESKDRAHTLAVVIQFRVLSVGLEITILPDQLRQWLTQLFGWFVTAMNPDGGQTDSPADTRTPPALARLVPDDSPCNYSTKSTEPHKKGTMT